MRRWSWPPSLWPLTPCWCCSFFCWYPALSSVRREELFFLGGGVLQEGIFLVKVKKLIGNPADLFVSLSGGHRLSEEAEEARRPDEQAHGGAGARHQEWHQARSVISTGVTADPNADKNEWQKAEQGTSVIRTFTFLGQNLTAIHLPAEWLKIEQ